MNETTKATFRRQMESDCGGFPWVEVFSGRAIDIGCGPDPLRLDDWPCLVQVRCFDQEQGDANTIDELLAPARYDVVHASQVLEHMHDPFDAFRRWCRLVEPGGHLVVTVPDVDLYEHCEMPSRFNGDHKSTWSLWRREAPTTFPHVFVPELLGGAHFPEGETWRVRRVALVDTNYDYMNLTDDQTLASAEAFIEFVVQRMG